MERGWLDRRIESNLRPVAANRCGADASLQLPFHLRSRCKQIGSVIGKYVVGWMLGVPVIVLVIIYVLCSLCTKRTTLRRAYTGAVD